MTSSDNRLYSGFIAGTVSTTITWPLNVIQVQRQVCGHLSNSKYFDTNNLSIINNIYNKNGLRGFYRGVSKGIWAYSIFYGSFFYTNDFLKSYLPEGKTHTIIRSYIAAGIGSIISNPFHVVRIRCQSEIIKNTYTPTTLRQIYRYEGVQALIKGLEPTLVKNLELSIIVLLNEYLSEKYFLPVYISTALGKLVATSITYPIDSYRTIRRFDSLLKVKDILFTFKSNPRKLYWGYGAYLLRSIPSTILAFHIYSALT